MTADSLVELLVQAAARATEQQGRISNLLLTQRSGFSEGRVREPEMRHALAQVCEARRLVYGIEVPTEMKYRFTEVDGHREVAARHDFALFTDAPLMHQKGRPTPEVLIEFKASQPAASRGVGGCVTDFPAITKDLQKLLKEPHAAGATMLHLLDAAGAGTIPAVLGKYRSAWSRATQKVHNLPNGRWFVFAVLVQQHRSKQSSPQLLVSTHANMGQLDTARFFDEAQMSWRSL